MAPPRAPAKRSSRPSRGAKATASESAARAAARPRDHGDDGSAGRRRTSGSGCSTRVTHGTSSAGS
ncbi:MAG: hypothetical protein IPN17_07910 [Deltaproteobacteria bacterium]|nr:hypothetical protein [Deltaproteobacteria bacterium]